MREYATVRPQFWTGDTGLALRAAGPDAMLVALYLLSSPYANMVGIYFIPITTIAHDSGLELSAAQAAMKAVAAAGFAQYDDARGLVWVVEMARYQIDESLEPNDKRVKGIVKQLEPFKKTPFYGLFLERYGDAFHLPKADVGPRPQGSPFEGPSKPLGSPFEAPSKALRSQRTESSEQEQKQKTTSAPSPAAPAARGAPPAKVEKAPNPRHAPLTEKLTAAFQATCGRKYGYQRGKDSKAVQCLLAVCDDDDEILRRWRFGLSLRGWPGIATIAELAQRWNHLATAPAATGPPRSAHVGMAPPSPPEAFMERPGW